MAITEEIERPTPGQFAGLARSSPWRWSTLRFTTRCVAGPCRPSPVRAYLRRPDRLRVEDLDGTLLEMIDHLQRELDADYRPRAR